MNAARFSGSIGRALEASLGRKVEFQKAYFTLFWLPGFSLEDVTIQENPRFGLEPFAYVPRLKARVRLDKLLFGQVQFSSVRLEEPSLNLVKQSDGTWNVVELLQHLSAPTRLPLNFFPAFEVAGGRIDVKFGRRKTMLYIADSDLSVYTQRSGKVLIQFSGSPARTDRAGNEFGHIRGTANWYVAPKGPTANRLEADITLDPSDLSELTTLMEGHDMGIHGTVGAHAKIAGPEDSMRVNADVRIENVHRWDLAPASGEDWRIACYGAIDLLNHRLELRTGLGEGGEASPVALQVRVNNFLAQPGWAILAELRKAPLNDLIPLSKRMGLLLPQEANLSGTVDGVIGYAGGKGLEGGVSIRDAMAKLDGVPPLRSANATVSINGDHVHFNPAIIEAPSGGTLIAAGDFDLASRKVSGSFNTDDFSISALRNTLTTWFARPTPLGELADGEMTGQISYSSTPAPVAGTQTAGTASWTGQFQFANASLNLPGLSVPLESAAGRVTVDGTRFDLRKFSALFNGQPIYASYRFDDSLRRPERVSIEMPAADVAQLESALAPSLEGQGLLARLRVTRRSLPDWLVARNLDGQLTIDRFSVSGADLGPLAARFTWEGPNVQFTSLQVNLPEGLIRAGGSVNLTSYLPRYRFKASLTGLPWNGGLVSADGQFLSSGMGSDVLRNSRATGRFSSKELELSPEYAFDDVSGAFDLSFAEGWPDLHLINVQAMQDEDQWAGDAESRRDGKLLVNLTHAGKQVHIVSTLASTPQTAASSSRRAVVF